MECKISSTLLACNSSWFPSPCLSAVSGRARITDNIPVIPDLGSREITCFAHVDTVKPDRSSGSLLPVASTPMWPWVSPEQELANLAPLPISVSKFIGK